MNEKEYPEYSPEARSTTVQINIFPPKTPATISRANLRQLCKSPPIVFPGVTHFFCHQTDINTRFSASVQFHVGVTNSPFLSQNPQRSQRNSNNGVIQVNFSFVLPSVKHNTIHDYISGLNLSGPSFCPHDTQRWITPAPEKRSAAAQWQLDCFTGQLGLAFVWIITVDVKQPSPLQVMRTTLTQSLQERPVCHQLFN